MGSTRPNFKFYFKLHYRRIHLSVKPDVKIHISEKPLNFWHLTAKWIFELKFKQSHETSSDLVRSQRQNLTSKGQIFDTDKNSR